MANLMVFIHPVILKDEEHVQRVTQRRYNFMKGMRQQLLNDEWSVESDRSVIMDQFDTFSPDAAKQSKPAPPASQ